jgi:bacterioferritin-associated ferredoxin
MIICSCNVLSDHEVRTAMVAEVPPRTPGELYRCLGCDARCGRCVRSIKRIMQADIEGARGAGRGHHDGRPISRRGGQAGHHRHKI